MLRWLLCPGRSPGLTESVSALRTSPSLYGREAESESSGVEQVGAEAAGVIAADGQIRIVGDAATVSVYNAAGQAVAINSAERTFAVARGMYVVVVDGKATKVIVR